MSPSEAYPCPMCGAWHGTDTFAVSDKLNAALAEVAELQEELAATDAEVKKIVDSREAALDKVERLQEELADISRAAGYIESDESALEAVQRTIRGWSDRCYSAEETVARLQEAIKRFAEAFDRDPIKYADLMDRTGEAVEALCEIAREGK